MIDRNQRKSLSRDRRHRRIRAKVSGSAQRPRLAVFRSAKHISAQLIDDVASRTLAAATDLAVEKKVLTELAKGDKPMAAKTAVAFAVGRLIAVKAKQLNLESVIFDRGGFAYTGRVAALAEGARAGGLQF